MKKVLAFIVVLAMACMFGGTAYGDSAELQGAISALKVLAGDSITYPDADVDGNGKVEMQDAVLALQIVAGFRAGTPDIVLLVPTSTDTLKLAWLPVSSNSTPSNEMAYQVHLSKDENFEPSATTLRKTVKGDAQADVSGLEKATAYYAVIVAVDKQGNKSISHEYSSVTTFESEAELKQGANPVKAEELNLGIPVIDGTTYTYQKSADTVIPEIDSVIFGKNDSGGTYMRKVKSSSVNGNQIIVETENISLSNVLETGTVSSNIKLFDVGEVSGSDLGRRADGTRYSRMVWKDELLIAEQTDFYHDSDELEVHPEDSPGQYNIKLRRARDIEQEVSLDTRISFEPELITDVRWEGSTIEKAEVVAKGTLNFDAVAKYSFTAAKTYEKEFELFRKSWISTYPVGAVPVVQKISLILKATITAEASAKIETGINAHAGTWLALGVRYNPAAKQWEPVTDSGFEKSLTANLSIQGGVKAEVRLIPEVEVRFYEVAASSLYVEPYLRGEIGIETIANADLLTGHYTVLTQPTAFDVALGLECFVEAKLDVLVAEIPLLPKTRILGPPPKQGWEITLPEYMLFSLPEIELKASDEDGNIEAGEEIQLTAKIKHGENNKFNPSSLKWEIYPEPDEKSEIELKPGNITETEDGYSANATLMSCAENKTFTVFVSGYGILGEISRKFATWTFTVTGKCEPIAAFTATPLYGEIPLTVSLDASASSDAGKIVSYEWTVTDGNVKMPTPVLQKTEGKTAYFKFDKQGIYRITLTIMNDRGYTAEEAQYVNAGSDCERYYGYPFAGYESDGGIVYNDGDLNFFNVTMGGLFPGDYGNIWVKPNCYDPCIDNWVEGTCFYGHSSECKIGWGLAIHIVLTQAM